MAMVVGLRRSLIHQPQVRLVNERGGLQRMVRPLSAQMAPRDPAQLLVYEGQKAMQRIFVAGAPQPKELTWRWGLG